MIAPFLTLDQRRRDLAEQSFDDVREFDLASRAWLHERRLLVDQASLAMLAMFGFCAPFWAPSGFDSGRRKPRSASTSMRIERKMWSEKCGWSLVVKRDAAGSVIHAGKQANEPSG